MRKSLGSLAAVAICVGLAAAAQATPIIVGGSALLTAGTASQLETWLGEGPLTLTNIFTMTVGSTGSHFHAAADGQGRTFAILEVSGIVKVPTQEAIVGTHIIGGYNPQSWSSVGGFTLSPPYPADAFIFNLTTSTMLPQTGIHQTFNYPAWGPVFGGGADIFTGNLTTEGYAYSYSYGTPGSNVFGDQWHRFNIDRMEVFTISNSAEAVPEPTTLALLGAGLVAVRARRRAGLRIGDR